MSARKHGHASKVYRIGSKRVFTLAPPGTGPAPVFWLGYELSANRVEMKILDYAEHCARFGLIAIEPTAGLPKHTPQPAVSLNADAREPMGRVFHEVGDTLTADGLFDGLENYLNIVNGLGGPDHQVHMFRHEDISPNSEIQLRARRVQ